MSTADALRSVEALTERESRHLLLILAVQVPHHVLRALGEYGASHPEPAPALTGRMSLADVEPPAPPSPAQCPARRNTDGTGRCILIAGHLQDHEDAEGLGWHLEPPALPFVAATAATTTQQDTAALDGVK